MPFQDSEHLFDALVKSVESCCVEKQFGSALRLCEDEGMAGGEKQYNAMGQHFVFTKTFPGGDTVEFELKWYDKSKPFSIQPDIHRFNVKRLAVSGGSNSHSNSYED